MFCSAVIDSVIPKYPYKMFLSRLDKSGKNGMILLVSIR